MTDKVKQAARHVQRETGMSYQTCRSLVTGYVVFTAQADDCLTLKALEGSPRWADPKPGAMVTACRCGRCDPGKTG
jgi:hypothetical protein